MQRDLVTSQAIWCGKHFLLYKRAAGQERETVRLSLFVTDYSPHGEGHAAFLHVHPAPGWNEEVSGVYTDNPQQAKWLFETLYEGKDTPFAESGSTLVPARFSRGGSHRHRLVYHIEAHERAIEASWSAFEAPFMHHGPGGIAGSYIYSLFFEAHQGTVAVEQEPVAGELYPRQDWQPVVGRPLSSALIGHEIWLRHHS